MRRPKVSARAILKYLSLAGVIYAIAIYGIHWQRTSLPAIAASSLNSGSSAFAAMSAVPLGPIAAGIFVALFGFLFLERWRRIESDVSDIRNTIQKIGGEAADRMERRVGQYLEDKTKKLDAMDNQVRKLLEDHPWIIGLTENDFIPNIPSCRMVLTTVDELLAKRKRALVYEYLYGWLNNADGVPRLEGTLDDFFDLIRFCDQELNDDYLCVLILREVVYNVEAGARALPDYCRRLMRAGNYSEATRASDRLLKIVNRPWWKKVWGHTDVHPLMLRPDFVFKAHISLALYTVCAGERKTRRAAHVAEISRLAGLLEREDEMLWADIERRVFAGTYASARDLIRSRKRSSKTPSSFAYLEDILGCDVITGDRKKDSGIELDHGNEGKSGEKIIVETIPAEEIDNKDAKGDDALSIKPEGGIKKQADLKQEGQKEL